MPKGMLSPVTAKMALDAHLLIVSVLALLIGRTV